MSFHTPSASIGAAFPGGCNLKEASSSNSNGGNNSSQRKSGKGELPPLFYYMEMGDWERAEEQMNKHPNEIKTWATLRTTSTPVTPNNPKVAVNVAAKRLALHHACFKLRSAGSASPPSGSGVDDPFLVLCRFILNLVKQYPEAAGQRESRHGCLPLHLAAFASCAPRSMAEQEAMMGDGSDHSYSSGSCGSPGRWHNNVRGHRRNASSGSPLLHKKPGVIDRRSISDATSGTQDTFNTTMSTVHREEQYTGEIGDKNIRLNTATRPQNPNVAVAAKGSSIIIYPKREEMALRVINALLDAYPKAIRVDSEGGRLPLHTACAGRATPRVIATLLTAYPAAARHRNKDGFLPLHLAAHWGVSHPNVAICLLKCYPDATVGRNRWERTPLEEALCMAGENGRPHQNELVRTLRKHPSYWNRPPPELFEASALTIPKLPSSPVPSLPKVNKSILTIDRVSTTAVDIDESLPSNESSDEQRWNPPLAQGGEVHEIGDEVGHEVELTAPLSPPIKVRSNLLSRLSPRRAQKKKVSMWHNGTTSPIIKEEKEDESMCAPKANLEHLIRDERWEFVLARLRERPDEARKQLEVMTKGGFVAMNGMMPLHYACERNPPMEVVMALIEANPNAISIRSLPGGALPLHVACTWYASASVVSALLSADAGACQIADELGNIPLHSACFSGASILVVESLLAASSKSVLARNHQGSLPLDICKRLRHENRRSVVAALTLKKEEILAKHRRSKSSGTWSDTAQEAAELNERLGSPKRSSVVKDSVGDRKAELVLDEQAIAVEVAYQDNKGSEELLWV